MLKKAKNKKERVALAKELKIINKENNFIKIKTPKGAAAVLTAAAVLSLLGLLISKQDRSEIVKSASANYQGTNYTVNSGGGCFGGCFNCVCVDAGCAGGGCGL